MSRCWNQNSLRLKRECTSDSQLDVRIVALEAKVAEFDYLSNGLRRDLEEVKARNAGLECHDSTKHA